LQIDPRALDDAEAQRKPCELSRQPSTAESCVSGSGKDYMLEVSILQRQRLQEIILGLVFKVSGSGNEYMMEVSSLHNGGLHS
jgi:hypothetical protein